MPQLPSYVDLVARGSLDELDVGKTIADIDADTSGGVEET